MFSACSTRSRPKINSKLNKRENTPETGKESFKLFLDLLLAETAFYQYLNFLLQTLIFILQ